MATTPANNSAPKPRTIRSIDQRMRKNIVFNAICFCATMMALVILLVLLVSILTQGVGTLSLDFLTSLNSSDPHKAGVKTSVVGTIFICGICALSAIPLGVGTAILIEEFKPKGETTSFAITLLSISGVIGFLIIAYLFFGLTGLLGHSIFLTFLCFIVSVACAFGIFYSVVRFIGGGSPLVVLHGIIDTNIRNLAGVPSIVYGILGVTAFATMFNVFGPMNNGHYAIGQHWYDQYEGEDKKLYYVKADGPLDTDPDQAPATKDMTLYYSAADGAGLGEPVTGLDWVTAEEIEPRVKAIEDELRVFESSFRAGIKAAQDGRRGPVVVDPEKAEAIVDTAIKAGTWKNPDTSELRATLVELVLGLDGKSGVDLITARKRAIKEAVNSEYAARMPDVITIGKMPGRVDTKSWYHLALPFGRGVLAGGLTLMLVILPIVIVASQEALRAVPGSYRQGALALGATKWQSVSKTALPAAIPGICTGTILAISRAIGEAAPILVLGGTGFITSTPQHLMAKFSALPMTIFQWTKEPEAEFKDIAASGIIVLLIVLLSFNAVAIFIRQRASRHQ